MIKVYVVEALRWGDRENHSYVVGARAEEIEAIRLAKQERNDRGGKYQCEVNMHCLLGDRARKVVYRTDEGSL